MSNTVTIPDVSGKTQTEAEQLLKAAGLTIVKTEKVLSNTAAVGSVIGTNPAKDATVDSGTTVNLLVSSEKIAVPDISGLTQSAAEGALRNAGLKLGEVKTVSNHAVPSGGVIETSPPANTVVGLDTAVTVHKSNGPPGNWSQYVPTGFFVLLGCFILGAIGYGIFEKSGAFLQSLSNRELTRGLITFLIAVSTVGIALILCISTIVLDEGPESAQRFDRGKQILANLIGVLGTIVGFYYGSTVTNTNETDDKKLAIVTKTLPVAAVKTEYYAVLKSTGGKLPIKWSVSPGLPAKLSLDADNGVIHGIADEPPPDKKFTFTLKDNSAPPITVTQELILDIK